MKIEIICDPRDKETILEALQEAECMDDMHPFSVRVMDTGETDEGEE